MENTRKTRARSKSAGAPAETDVKTNAEKENVQESEANVIDDTPLETKDPKTVENNDADKMDTVSDEPPKEDETKLPETPRGARTRKRKASEMKANDSITEEESKEKKSNVEPSKEAEEPENDESKKTTEPENDKSNETTEPEKNTSNEAEEVTQITSEDILSSSEIKVEREDLTSDTDVSMRMSESEMGMPAIQTLGKGKRARIPNKRYSDIMLSPNHKPKIENGSDSEPATKPPPSPEPAPVSTKPTRTSTSSPVQGYKKSKAPTDITNPAFLKPFTLGWKRELVWRATSDSSQKGKRSGDIYYYTPSGKKVRSMREVSENLKSKDGLTLENFSFTKEPIGLDDPEKEVIRDAKYKAGSGMAKKVLTKKAPSARNSPKVLSPKLNSPKVTSPKAMIPNETADSPPKATPKGNDSPPKTTPKGNAKGLGNFKIKLPGKKAEKKKSEEEMDVEAPPAKQAATTPSTRRSAKWANFAREKPCQPCSIMCQGVQGLVPTLQCCYCLCLYHHECVGAPPNMALAYVCKNCQLDGQNTNQPAPAPPPLTPINALRALSAPSAALPKLQRIPRDGDTIEENIPPPPHTENNNKSLVGSLTTWLPHNSKIINNLPKANEPPPHDLVRPQYLEILGGRKFLVIPKHNFMTVSSNSSAPVNNNNGLAHVAEDIKTEPVSPLKSPHAATPMDVETASTEATSLVAPSKDEFPEQTPEVTPPAPPKKKLRVAKQNNGAPLSSDKNVEGKFMEHYLQNLSYGYSTLLYVFQYLKVQDLLRAGCVCTMWRDVAGHSSLWRTVRMKNSQVHSFDGLADTLKKHGTGHLDLRKMLLPSGGDEIWPRFSQAISRVDTLRKIELCRCPASVVEQLALSNPQLEVINAVTIKCEVMSLEALGSLTKIKELRIKSTNGLTLTSDIDSLRNLNTIQHISLTSIKDLYKLNLGVIAELKNLESLDLGECNDFPSDFGENVLVKLENLEKLRLEKGQGKCHTFEMLSAVKEMKKLEQLELVNFDIKSGFDKALGACCNVKKLLIIPTYISQSATTNHMVLGGVLRLHKTLSHFVWGVTLELLRVTELFVDQCEEPASKDKKEKKPAGNGDSIPVLKPVPLITEKDDEIAPAHDPPQVEILPLPNLQKLLLQSLPTTRVKILKIPFHATWRQSITDSVN